MTTADATTSAGSRSGRRERKKAATRASIATAALELFLERGFDEVSIREIAEKADVAVATIFAHFSGKEALVFDEDADIARSLVAAVERRPEGVDALGALETWCLTGRAAEDGRETSPGFAAFQRLVKSTPALREYWKGMWRRYEPGLAEALAGSSGVDARTAHLIATLMIEGYVSAADDENPAEALAMLFQVLRGGVRSLAHPG